MADEETHVTLAKIGENVKAATDEIIRLRDGHGDTRQRISDVEGRLGAAAAVTDNRVTMCEGNADKLDERMATAERRLTLVEAYEKRMKAAEKKAQAAHDKAQGIEDGDTKAAKKAGRWASIPTSVIILVVYAVLNWAAQNVAWFQKLLPGGGGP